MGGPTIDYEEIDDHGEAEVDYAVRGIVEDYDVRVDVYFMDVGEVNGKQAYQYLGRKYSTSVSEAIVLLVMWKVFEYVRRFGNQILFEDGWRDSAMPQGSETLLEACAESQRPGGEGWYGGG